MCDAECFMHRYSHPRQLCAIHPVVAFWVGGTFFCLPRRGTLRSLLLSALAQRGVGNYIPCKGVKRR